MIKGDFIRVVLSSGVKEEGVIFDPRFLDEDNVVWVILAHKNNPDLKLNICKKYIAAYQVENLKVEEIVESLIVEDLSLEEPVADPKLRMKKLVDLKINKSNMEREQFRKIINKKTVKPKVSAYSLPSFLKA
jgi:hypothetical protein